MSLKHLLGPVLVLAACGLWPIAAQTPVGAPVGGPAQAGAAPVGPQPPPAKVPPAAEMLRPSYKLGPGDIVQVRATGAEELAERSYRVQESGEITLPLIGALKVAGMTVDQLQTEIDRRLRAYILNPQTTVTLTQFRSEPVFFLGAFKTPGIYPIQGRGTLVDMMTIIGGLNPNASRRIRLARRKEMGPIPLPSAVEDPDGKGMYVDISLAVLTEEINPPEDIQLEPYDVVTAEKAELVYVNGEIAKPGAYELGEKDSIGVLQLLGTAGGPTPTADLRKARILRPISNSARRAQIGVDLKASLSAEGVEPQLLPNDILYVPRSASKMSSFGKVAVFVVPLVTTIIVYGVLIRK